MKALWCVLLQGCAGVVASNVSDRDATVETAADTARPRDKEATDLPARSEESTDTAPPPDVAADLPGPVDAVMDREAAFDASGPIDLPVTREVLDDEPRVGETCHSLPWGELVNVPRAALDAGAVTRPLRRGTVPDGDYVLRRVDRLQPAGPRETPPDLNAWTIRVAGTHWQIAQFSVSSSFGVALWTSCELQQPTLIDHRVCRYTCPASHLDERSPRYYTGAFTDYEMRGAQLAILEEPYYLYTFDRVMAR